MKALPGFTGELCHTSLVISLIIINIIIKMIINITINTIFHSIRMTIPGIVLMILCVPYFWTSVGKQHQMGEGIVRQIQNSNQLHIIYRPHVQGTGRYLGIKMV